MSAVFSINNVQILMGWPSMSAMARHSCTERLRDSVQLVRDHDVASHPGLITHADERSVHSASLIKPNQIGSAAETLKAMPVYRDVRYPQMVSPRFGERDESVIADLSVATGWAQVKSGAPCRGERVEKDKRLVHIAAHLPEMPVELAVEER